MLELESLLNLRQLIPYYLLIATTLLSISCAITLFIPYSICSVIPALTTYGKTAEQLETYKFINSISVPKRWFKHFYIIGTINLLFWIHTIYSIFYKSEKAPEFLKYLTTLTKSQEEPGIPFSTAVLCLSLILFHVARRLFETLFVSVYSDSRMNLFHYTVGIIHYIILPISILCETQGIASKSDLSRIKFNFYEITITQWIGALIFALCNWQQHILAEKIANTRKGPRGLIRNYAYGICFGGWFNYVSCPHFLFEILIYLSLLMVVPTAYAYKFVVLFVCVNQTFAAEITHKWYQKTFPKYPAKRKALIPYIL